MKCIVEILLTILVLVAIGAACNQASSPPSPLHIGGVYYIDSETRTQPTQQFQKMMRCLQQIGYYPPYRQYVYTKEVPKRPPNAPLYPDYKGDYVTDCWSIKLCAPDNPPESDPVLKIYGYELAKTDTIYNDQLTDFFGTAVMDKHTLYYFKTVYYFVPLHKKYSHYRDTVFDYIMDVTSWKRSRDCLKQTN
jgi:hypothetical protein